MPASHQPLYVRTPLVYSSVMSSKAGCNVYLKLENAQPSGSFKNRGIGHLAQRSLDQYGARTHLICSSGGNAGLACAYAAWSLGVKSTIMVPLTTKQPMVDRLRGFGSEVVQGGNHWAEADEKARALVACTTGGVYVPPFDHPTVVEGHSSMIRELEEQLEDQGIDNVAAVVCSVGGGGLIGGILRGMDESKSFKVPVVACETRGAASLALSLKAAYQSSPPTTVLQTLPGITTIASTLGAVKVSQECLDRCVGHDANGGVVSIVMEDERAVAAIRSFADDHAFFVEPACSASLTPIYDPSILQAALPSTPLLSPGTAPPKSAPAIVVIVCGGNSMSLDTLALWEADFKGKGLGEVTVLKSGKETVLPATA